MNTNLFTSWFKRVQSKSNGFEFNRSIESRVYSAMKSQERRFGKLTKADNLTAEDIHSLIEKQNDVCPMCGYSFNSFTRSNEDGFSWEIAHIKTPENGGHMNLNNVQLLHKRCNSVLYKDAIDVFEQVRKSEYNCFVDLVIANIKRKKVTKGITSFEKYVRLYEDLRAGYDPNTSARS